jgi:hypothetical protein
LTICKGKSQAKYNCRKEFFNEVIIFHKLLFEG